MLSFISFLTDAVRLENFDPLWFIVSGAGFLPPIAIGLIYRFAYLNRRRERPRVVLNLIVAGLAGASRNVSVGFFAMWAGLDQSQLWLFRFFGGAFMGVAIFILWAIGNGSKIEYLSALRSLAETQNRLSSTRLQMPEQLASVNERLQERTKQALLPQLNAIRELLGEASTVRAALDKLRFTITEQIRPMMLEISKDQPKPTIFMNR